MVEEFEPGQLLAGKYRVEQVIGRGGMGVVLAARHLGLNERVAVKVLQRSALGNREALERFQREARIAAKINNEYVARVMDVGELDSGDHYIIMEYLKGEDLAAWIGRGPLAVEQAVEFALQTCVALADAHALGVVHRDIKPANLFCAHRSDGRPLIKVLDFGVSKLSDAARELDILGAPITRTAATIGTPLYMSPEQVRDSKLVDARSDIWSLGVVLFEMLAGTPPFSGQSFGEIAVQIVSEPIVSLATRRAELPPGLEQVVGKCLERSCEQRFSNVAELAVALQPFAPKRARELVERVVAVVAGSQDLTVESSSVGGAAPSSDVTQTAHRAAGTIAPWATKPERGTAHRRRVAFALGAATCVVGLVLVWRSRPSATPEAEQAEPFIRSAIFSASSGMSNTPADASAAPATKANPQNADATVAASETAAAPLAPAPTNHRDEPSAAPRSGAGSPSVKPSFSPRSNPTAAATSPTAKDCSPPYTTDAAGRKHFKRQCFKNTAQ